MHDHMYEAREIIGQAIIKAIRENDIQPGAAIWATLETLSTLIAMTTSDAQIDMDIEMAHKSIESGTRLRWEHAKKLGIRDDFPTEGTA